MEYRILSLAIPLLTIILAIVTKDVIISLFSEGWITKTVIFMLLVGAIIRILEDSGAVDSFVHYLSHTASYIDSPKRAMFLAYLIGIVIFMESSIISMVAGTVAKPLFDKNQVSREKLAYICDSTSAPVCSLIPLNGWGALLLGLIITAVESQVIQEEPLSLLIASIPYNFYAISTLLLF